MKSKNGGYIDVLPLLLVVAIIAAIVFVVVPRTPPKQGEPCSKADRGAIVVGPDGQSYQCIDPQNKWQIATKTAPKAAGAR